VRPTAERQRDVTDLLCSVPGWAHGRGDLAAVGLAGSWARDRARMASDVDLVLLTTAPDRYTGSADWLAFFGGELIRAREWGAITERRLRRRSGLVIELGVGSPGWASTDPVDDGTRRVVTDGFRPLYDPTGLLRNLQSACI
jgi:uncharacterized protein